MPITFFKKILPWAKVEIIKKDSDFDENRKKEQGGE